MWIELHFTDEMKADTTENDACDGFDSQNNLNEPLFLWMRGQIR